MEHVGGGVNPKVYDLDRRERMLLRSLIDARIAELGRRVNEHIGRGIEPSSHDENERAELFALRRKVTG